MARSNQARLQDRILLYLSRHEIQGVSQLARELDGVRSSVSRAMHALAKSGLVTQADSTWRLTDAGRKEAENLQEQLPKRTISIAKAIERMRNQQEQVLRAANPGHTIHQSLGQFTALSRAMDAPYSGLNAAAKVLRQRFVDQVNVSPLADAFAQPGLHSTIEGLQGHMIESATHALRQVMNETSRNALQYRIDADSIGQRITSLAASPGLAAPYSGSNAVAEVFRQRFVDQGNVSPLADAFAQPGLRSALEGLNNYSSYFASKAFSSVGETLIDGMRSAATTLTAQVPSVRALAATKSATALFAESQRDSLAALGMTSRIDSVNSLSSRELAAANLGVSKIINDLGLIQSRLLVNPEAALNSVSLLPRVADIGQTYNGYIHDVTGGIGPEKAFPDLSGRIVIPTSTTATFIETVRDVTLVDEEAVEQQSSYDQAWHAHAAMFREVFATLGPNFENMWQGAFQVLHSSNPDRIRLAAHSGREILMQALALLAPDHLFPDEERQPSGNKRIVTRQMRIKKILTGNSKSSIDWVNSVAAGCDAMYDRLAGVSHDRSTAPRTTAQQVTGYLHTMGGMLLYILDSWSQE